jgi:hypothetical protein
MPKGLIPSLRSAHRGCLLLLAGTISFAVAQAQNAVAPVPACTPAPPLLQMIRDPLLVRALDKRMQAHPAWLAPDGATTLSQEWLDGKRKDWFIENQREGADMIAAGVVLKDHALVGRGLLALEWGFKRQSNIDGGFPESGDAFHSVSVYLVDVTSALLALREAQPEFRKELPRMNALVPHVEAAALWLLRPEVLPLGRERDNPFTHRKWILAAALGNAGRLAGNPQLTAAAEEFAREGLALQMEDGENPERGGFDVSYQMVDALQGARYYTSLQCGRDAQLMREIRAMLSRTCAWERLRLLPDGSVDTTGSTRILKEKTRGGVIKKVNYPEVIQAYVYTSEITGDPHDHQIAERMAASQGW